jgi:NADH-quinone oxidoreductase subunit C
MSTGTRLVDVLPEVDALASPPTAAVDASSWHGTAQALFEAGAHIFEWLSAVDRGTHVEVALHVRDAGPGVIVLAAIGDGSIASVADVWAGAAWHERETAEMFGVTFIGSPSRERLLLAGMPEEMPPPLLRSSALPRRVATPWPGTVEPGETEQDRARRARRGPQLPPGVRPEWIAAPEADA